MSRRKAADTLSSNGLLQFINLLMQNMSLSGVVMEAFHPELVGDAAVQHLNVLQETAMEHQFSKMEAIKSEAMAMEDNHRSISPNVSDMYDLFLLYQFMADITWTPLLMLATTVLDVCGDTVGQRAMALQSVAATFRRWNTTKLGEAERLLKTTPSHMECTAVLELDFVETIGAQPLVELLKLMPQDTEALSECLKRSSDRQLQVAVQVLSKLGVVDQKLYSLKKLVDSPHVPLASAASALAGMFQATSGVLAPPILPKKRAAPALSPVVPATPEVPPPAAFSSSNCDLSLIFRKECNRATVYHKILKPFPTLEVTGKGDYSNLIIKAELFKYEGENPEVPGKVLPYLEGEQRAELKTNVAMFRKLKISLTTTSVGCPFLLRFSLFRVVEEQHVPLGVYVQIGPIEVFSHTSYLKPAGPKVKSDKKKPRRKSPAWEESDSE